VDDYLVAVVSLPAGVFQPYSGVKTSILILDKELAKRSSTIGFFKFENDGFGLGAQRKLIIKNDLPKVEAEIGNFLSLLRMGESTSDYKHELGLVIDKREITETGDYNLSRERFQKISVNTSNYPFVALSELVNVKNGFAFKSEDYIDKGLRVIRIKNVQKGKVIDNDPKFIAFERQKEFIEFALKASDILMSLTGNVGRVGRLKIEHEPAVLNQRVAYIQPKKDAQCLDEYLFLLLNTDKFESDAIAGSSGVAQANLSSKWVSHYQIPLPPLEVQKAIVSEIKGYQKVIDGARAVVDNYRPQISIEAEWPIVKLGQLCSVGGTITTDVDLTLPYIGADSIESDTGKLLKMESAKSQKVNGPVYAFNGERLLYSKIRPYLNKLSIVNLNGYCSSDMYPLLLDYSKVKIAFLAAFMLSETFNARIHGYYERASIPKINRSQLFQTEIPLPPLTTQRAIVAEIEAEQKLVDANRELIARFEKKIQAVLARVWGEMEER
ncbi:MAG: restriction endonuclease subunit S, partial [Spirochaetes bacterium]|nr:restriction endonuclease subunit S [Spirochaetota bacterium]